MLNLIRRRAALFGGVLAAALLTSCATAPSAPTAPVPIIFVHGNGDSSALWSTTLWRFESNGWPRDRLQALDMPLPTARDNDAVAQAGRSSIDEFAQHLKREVDAMLERTGAKQVALVGNSRGGNAIRHYIQNLGGAAKVSHAVLGGTPNHGVWNDPAYLPGNEFNGAGPFLKGLNAPKGANGDEVTPGVQWLTLRSDNNDKYAQADGVWIGRRGQPTNVTADGPALKGALNVVLPRRDHREVSYHHEAFEQTHRFLTGAAPKTLAVTPEAQVVLDGRVSVPGTNRPLAGSSVEVFEVDAATGARRGASIHKQNVSSDGFWGPMVTRPDAVLEFVVTAPNLAITHLYRGPFPRSSALIHFRPERIADADKDATALVLFNRPRAYFGLPRDKVVLDGQNPAPGIPQGVAGVAQSKVKLKDSGRAVVGEFASEGITERLVGRAWPLAENRVTVLELNW